MVKSSRGYVGGQQQKMEQIEFCEDALSRMLMISRCNNSGSSGLFYCLTHKGCFRWLFIFCLLPWHGWVPPSIMNPRDKGHPINETFQFNPFSNKYCRNVSPCCLSFSDNGKYNNCSITCPILCLVVRQCIKRCWSTIIRWLLQRRQLLVFNPQMTMQ